MLSSITSKVLKRSVHNTQRQAATTVSRRTNYKIRKIAKKTVNLEELPYSPHVTIYRFPLPAIASISHRITGAALFAGFSAIGVVAAFNPATVPAIFACIKSSAVLTFLTKSVISVPLIYHALGGARHLLWDSGETGIENLKAVRDSSKRLIISTALLSFALIVLL